MHQSTTSSLSQTIWPRWASRQFLTVPIVQTLFPVTFGYSLSSESVVMRQLRRWKRLWRRSLTRSHKRTSMGLPEVVGTVKVLYFEGDYNFMCVLSIKVPVRNKFGNLSYAPRTFYPSDRLDIYDQRPSSQINAQLVYRHSSSGLSIYRMNFRLFNSRFLKSGSRQSQMELCLPLSVFTYQLLSVPSLVSLFSH